MNGTVEIFNYVVFFTEIMYFEMHVAFVFIYCLLISMTWIDAYCL